MTTTATPPAPPTAPGDDFHARFPEQDPLSQFWYAPDTVAAIVADLAPRARRVACLSAPSIHFALPDALRRASVLFDPDPRLRGTTNVVAFDFLRPDLIPRKWHQQFDAAVIDPPYLGEDIWRAYATAWELLVRPGARLILSTLPTYAPLLADLFAVRPVRFLPDIPTLPYQYDLYTNAADTTLDRPNPALLVATKRRTPDPAMDTPAPG